MEESGYQLKEDAVVRTEFNVEYGSVPESSIRIINYERLSDEPGHYEDRLVFDLINAPASHANALRRTLLSRVPSVAIEGVGILDNTGVMPDEILCHRLGLLPIAVNPGKLDYPAHPSDVCDSYNDPGRVLLFGLNIICGEGPEANYEGARSDWEGSLPPCYTGPDGMVYSKDLVWLPFPGQEEIFPEGVRPLHLDIPLTQLRPGQQIHLYCRAIKGIGADHAKFSPVCTAFYRLVPIVELTQPRIFGIKASYIHSVCHQGVFDLEDGVLKVVDPRNCTSCRECIRENEENKDGKNQPLIKLGKQLGVYEFTVESVGVHPAPVLVEEAFAILALRCEEIIGKISRLVDS